MKISCIVFFWCLHFSTVAQISSIDTDRPDQTESVFLVPKRWVQFEAGFNYQVNNVNEKEFLTPTLLSKYGLSNKIELRLITTINTNSSRILPYGALKETGLEAVQVGAKISLFEEKNLLPKTSLLFHFGIPAFSSAKFKPDKVAPDFRFTMQHTLSEKTSLGYNLGCEWDGYTNNPAYIYTLTIGTNLAKEWYSYIEGFGSFKKQFLPEHNIDGGVAYFISNDFKLDLSTGFGLFAPAPQWYIAFGASVRFKTGN